MARLWCSLQMVLRDMRQTMNIHILQCMLTCAWTYILHIYPLGCGRPWCCTRRAVWSQGLSRNHLECIGYSLSSRFPSDSAAQKGERIKSFKSFLQSNFGFKMGLSVWAYAQFVNILCVQFLINVTRCKCWELSEMSVLTVKTQKLKCRQWNINRGTQRERETWERGCQSNPEWHQSAMGVWFSPTGTVDGN